MPPRRRPPAPRAEEQPAREANESTSIEPTSSSPAPIDNATASAIHFFNTSFSTHRVSMLYTGPGPLNDARFRVLAHRLRNTLVGDVVRGVEVGLVDAGEEGRVLGAAGALLAVEIGWLPVAQALGIGGEGGDGVQEHEGLENNEDSESLFVEQHERDGSRKNSTRRGMHITLKYEGGTYAALLLPVLPVRGQRTEEIREHFVGLPLLLMRMPAPLKAVMVDFLSTTFDCRVSNLRLGTRTLVRSWEMWIRSVGAPSRGPLARDVVLTLGFHFPPAVEEISDNTGPEQDEEADMNASEQSLKTIDVFIPASQLRRFADAGKDLEHRGTSGSKRKHASWMDDTAKRRKLAGRLREEGWEWRAESGGGRDGDKTSQPFVEALARYVDEHLALNLFHPMVRVVKIACAGFAMSDGRLKVFMPADADADAEDAKKLAALRGQRQAVLELIRDLAEKARVTFSEGL